MYHQNIPQHARCPSSWFKGKKPIPPAKFQFSNSSYTGILVCWMSPIYRDMSRIGERVRYMASRLIGHKRVWPLLPTHPTLVDPNSQVLFMVPLILIFGEYASSTTYSITFLFSVLFLISMRKSWEIVMFTCLTDWLSYQRKTLQTIGLLSG